jgi:16S rRNA processing protein RimM
VLGAWGIKGWLKVQPYASPPQGLLQSRRWFLQPDEHAPADPGRSVIEIASARSHGELILAESAECPDRDAAEALRGSRVFVSRQTFPPADADEYYWVDLIGASVFNREGEPLGTVSSLLDTGVHSVLVVASPPAGGKIPAAPVERLIPFVSAYVDTVDLAARRIVVDWGLDF